MGAAGNAAGTENTSAPVSVRAVAIAKEPVSVTDVELMREAAVALEAMREAAPQSLDNTRGHHLFLANKLAEVTIAKLEERLLNE
jgi:hypothetical protein